MQNLKNKIKYFNLPKGFNACTLQKLASLDIHLDFLVSLALVLE